MNKYFVYYHVRLDKNHVFYIGKGTKEVKGNIYKRAYVKAKRNIYWKRITDKTAYKVEIIKEFETELEALVYEARLIQMFGLYKNGGNLCNLLEDSVNTASMLRLSVDKCSRCVYQYDLNGNFIEKYKSLSEVGRLFNTTATAISRACRKHMATCRGFQWRYDLEDVNPCKTHSRRKEFLKIVYQYDKDYNLINTFKGAREASEQTNVYYMNISKCLNKRCQYAGGFIWSKVELNKNIV